MAEQDRGFLSMESHEYALENVSIVPIPTLPEEIAHSLTTRPVHIIHNRNPFRLEERIESDLSPLNNESVGALVTRAGFEPADYEISLNGNRLEPEEFWNTAV